MNWGYKLLFAYLTFVVGIAVMIFKSSQEKIDLVAGDYYAKELKYQDRIDDLDRTDKLQGKLSCKAENNTVTIDFPGDFNGKTIEGDAVLYFAADETKDFKSAFKTSTNSFTLKPNKQLKGMYALQITWMVEGKKYYHEEKIFL
ncbi:MAG: hypothetical protein RLY16_2666 [Bacteroidota bacterium]|jgi:hypothetical protein